jgi:hypothetical protein
MIKKTALLLVMAISPGVFVMPAAAGTQSNANSQARDLRKAEKQRQKATKKYAKAQKKAERKMLKTERKNTRYPKQAF